MTFWQKVDRFPPVLCRLLARHKNGPPKTSLEISQESGLSVWAVESVSRLTEWDDVDLDTFRRFTAACGLDFFSQSDMKRVQSYLRGVRRYGVRLPPAYRYLKRHKDWEDYYRPLMELLRNSLAKKKTKSK